MKGTLLFDFQEAGSWLLSIDRGQMKLEEHIQQSGQFEDCCIRWKETEFIEMANNRLDFLIAFQQGRIHIEGNPLIAAAAAIFLRNI